MSDTITTTTQVDPAVSTFYDRVLLEAAKENLVHLRFAQHAMLNKKNGNTYKWRRYTNPSAATTPLTEGQDPPGRQMAKNDLNAVISFYGDFVTITEEVDLTVEDPTLTVAAEQNGYQANLTFDTLMRDILAACASSTNCSGGSNGGTPTEITRSDIDSVVNTLMAGNAKFVTRMVKAGTGIGSAPLRPAYWGIADADRVHDLEDCTGFKSTSEYASQTDVVEEEWGSVGNTRWLWTTNGYKTGDDYYMPIIGKDAYGDVELKSITNIVKGFNEAGSVLNRYATSGWSAAWTARILNDAFMHILKATASS